MSSEQPKFESAIKQMIISAVVEKADEALSGVLWGVMLLHEERATPESKQQLEAVMAACLEIKEHLALIDKTSAYQSSLNVLSRPDVLGRLFKA